MGETRPDCLITIMAYLERVRDTLEAFHRSDNHGPNLLEIILGFYERIDRMKTSVVQQHAAWAWVENEVSDLTELLDPDVGASSLEGVLSVLRANRRVRLPYVLLLTAYPHHL